MGRSARQSAFIICAALAAACLPGFNPPARMATSAAPEEQDRMTIDCLTIGPAAGGRPQQMIVLIHGLANNRFGLAQIGKQFSTAMPNAVIVLPQAPFPYDMDSDPSHRQWFSMKDWFQGGNTATASLAPGLEKAGRIVGDFIDRKLSEYGLDDSKLVVAGFSQGAMTALYTGLNRPSKVAGIIAWSGRFIPEAGIGPAGAARPPVLLMHGDKDTVIPVGGYGQARAALEKAGIQGSGGISHGTGHEVASGEVQAGIAFARTVLGLPSPQVSMQPSSGPG